ncbi:hypothetical protein AAEX28_06580 [Lentisphaerota bacterium WC36G]|nr:hypothetical protein LJT99_09445 [Lentisphaerae bacterium WC36]
MDGFRICRLEYIAIDSLVAQNTIEQIKNLRDSDIINQIIRNYSDLFDGITNFKHQNFEEIQSISNKIKKIIESLKDNEPQHSDSE